MMTMLNTADPTPQGKRKHTRHRANGTGTAYKRGNTWTAAVVVSWKPSKDGSHKVPVWARKGGFPTKKDALNYCPQLLKANPKKALLNPSLSDLYKAWQAEYASRIVPSTMGCYQAAFGHYKTLHEIRVDRISAHDLQTCMDACPSGKRTHENMKVLAGLLWAYALDANLVDKNVTENLYIGKHETTQRDPLTEAEIEIIRRHIGKIRYAEYVYCLCYLGFRPGEFLSLRKDYYKLIDGFACLVNGSKTEAGKDRIVIIPPQILDLVNARVYVPGTDLLFPQYRYKKSKDVFIGFKEMNDAYFRESVFKPMMSSLGIAKGKVPYSARHSYSDKLKRAEGSDKSKAGLMGHTDYAFTQQHYQSTDMEDLAAIASTIE